MYERLGKVKGKKVEMDLNLKEQPPIQAEEMEAATKDTGFFEGLTDFGKMPSEEEMDKELAEVEEEGGKLDKYSQLVEKKGEIGKKKMQMMLAPITGTVGTFAEMGRELGLIGGKGDRGEGAGRGATSAGITGSITNIIIPLGIVLIIVAAVTSIFRRK